MALDDFLKNLNKKTSFSISSTTNEYNEAIYAIESVPDETVGAITISNWEKFEGDYVEAEESILVVSLGLGREAIIPTKVSGYLEIINQTKWPNNLKKGEVLFKIYNVLSESKKVELLSLKNIRFKNLPKIETDAFTNKKKICWELVGGEQNQVKGINIKDSIIFESEKSEDILIFTLNNIDDKDYIIFKYPTKYYKLSKGDSISLLFENNEILKFVIINDSYKIANFSQGGHLFEVKIQITGKQLTVLKEYKLLKWQVSLYNNEKKFGSDVNYSNKFCVKKLANEYFDIVIKEIENYEPIENIIEILEHEEVCYVYLMVDTINKYHKIGISNNPSFREKTLQSEKPTIEMTCAKRFPSRKLALSFEQALHNTYDKFRIRGEWFELSDKDLNELKSVLSS